jgi:LPS-assembly protein
MAGVLTRVLGRLTGVLLLSLLFPMQSHAAGAAGTASPSGSGSPPLEVKADRIDYLQDQDMYEADGSVVVDQGAVHLTADHLTVQTLPGIMIATGHVRLTDPKADIISERLELNVNT